MEMLPPDQEPLPIRAGRPTNPALVRLDKYLSTFTKVLLGIAGLGLVVMLVLIVADVIGIKVFSNPVPGGIEYVSFVAVVAIAFAIAHTQVMRGHVAVDFIVDKFPRRVKLIIDTLTVLFSVCLFALLSYYSFKYAASLRRSGEVSMTQKIPFYPFVYAMAACFAVTLLVVIMDFVKAIIKAADRWTL